MKKSAQSVPEILTAIETKFASVAKSGEALPKTIFYRVTQAAHSPQAGTCVQRTDFNDGEVFDRKREAVELYDALELNPAEARAAFLHSKGMPGDAKYCFMLSFVEGEPLHEGHELYLSGYHDTDAEHAPAREIENSIWKHLGFVIEFDNNGEEPQF